MSNGFRYSEDRFLHICNVVDALNVLVTDFINEYSKIVELLNASVIGWIAEDSQESVLPEDDDDQRLALYDEGFRP